MNFWVILPMVLFPSFTPVAASSNSHNSLLVPSLFFAIISNKITNSSLLNLTREGGLPPWGKGLMSPVSWYFLVKVWRKFLLTPNLWASFLMEIFSCSQISTILFKQVYRIRFHKLTRQRSFASAIPIKNYFS